MQCTAHSRSKKQCKGKAIVGGNVCRMHGGGAPQVRAAARRRIAEVAARLVDHTAELALKSKVLPDITPVMKYLNDKADQYEPQPGTSGGDVSGGTFEEFLVSFRRKKPEGDE